MREEGEEEREGDEVNFLEEIAKNDNNNLPKEP